MMSDTDTGLSGVTITGGQPGAGSYGGGVLNTGHLRILDSAVTANRATAGVAHEIRRRGR